METKITPTITIELPRPAQLKKLDVASWPIWEKEASTFEWNYDQKETCYILKGRARVRSSIESVDLRPGDLVIFPKGLQCTWTILEPIKKHYKFG